MIDREKTGRPRVLRRDHYIVIDNWMNKDNELMTPRLTEYLIEGFPGLKVSERTVARGRQKLGRVHQTVKSTQLVRAVNKKIRVKWAQKMLDDKENFDNVIFTDESSFQRPKHTVKVNVWAGISKGEQQK